jgi:hypothetical protein
VGSWTWLLVWFHGIISLALSILVPRFYVFGTICYVHFFLLALMDSAWSQVFIICVICDIGCPVIEGPNRIGFFPHLRTETDPVSETSCFLSLILIPGRWIESKNPIFLKVIHHRQNRIVITRNNAILKYHGFWLICIKLDSLQNFMLLNCYEICYIKFFLRQLFFLPIVLSLVLLLGGHMQFQYIAYSMPIRISMLGNRTCIMHKAIILWLNGSK